MVVATRKRGWVGEDLAADRAFELFDQLLILALFGLDGLGLLPLLPLAYKCFWLDVLDFLKGFDRFVVFVVFFGLNLINFASPFFIKTWLKIFHKYLIL